MIENHLAGILAHWKWGVTNAFMEGLNSVFSATKRKARGYRSTTHLIAMLYFTAAKLRLPQCLYHRKQRGTGRCMPTA
ncbi:MAG: transposase [Verrucomicrobiota bacterium]